jgi:hypothetical protein
MQKESLVFKLCVLVLLLLACCAWVGKAQAGGYLPPRLSMDANAGGSATVGQADLLLSLKGDERRNLYLDPQAAYGSDEQWYADLGLGYRWIQNDAAILGGYIFAGHSQVANQSGFWIANPGVEALGSRWDARINGYIPVGGRSDDLGIVRFNQSSRLAFTGHSESLVRTYVNGDESQQIGDGLDARVGYQVLRGLPLKAYLGAYYFSIPHTNNVRGGAAGLEYWFDHKVKVFANYTYDNLQHNTVVGGLAISFGGVDESRADPSLSERLTDPVQRYLANLGHGSGIPSETLLTNLQTGTESVLSAASVNKLLSGPSSGSSSQTLLTDIAYFSQTGTPNNGGVNLTLANCTFENPCGPSDFSQTGVNTLNSLLPGTQMYFNGGAYNAVNGTGALSLNIGQGIWGRSADYLNQASGAALSQFNGAFVLTGNNTLDSIILNNSLGAATTAITSNGGKNLAINNSIIGSVNPYGVGMILVNASADLTGSNVNVSPQASIASGMLLIGSILDVTSSTINISTNVAYPTLSGITLDSGSFLEIVGSRLSVTSLNPSTNSIVGIFAQKDSDAIINESAITVNGKSGIFTFATGLETSSLTNDSFISMIAGTLTVSGSSTSILRFGDVQFLGTACSVNGDIYHSCAG